MRVRAETMMWAEPKTSGDLPAPVCGHSLTYAPSTNRLYVFGGAHRMSDHVRFATMQGFGGGSPPPTSSGDSDYPINSPPLSTASSSTGTGASSATSSVKYTQTTRGSLGGHIHYSSVGGSDSRKDSMPYPGSSSVRPSATTVLIIGGHGAPGHTRTETSTPQPSESGRGSTHAMGGPDWHDYSADLFSLDPASGVWTVLPAAKPPLPRYHPPLLDSCVLCIVSPSL